MYSSLVIFQSFKSLVIGDAITNQSSYHF
uniref:Uncharacterized protein n=1 Tax=Arundo donax TaxID=35708 RepID=A0A0A9GVB1_ARUDO